MPIVKRRSFRKKRTFRKRRSNGSLAKKVMSIMRFRGIAPPSTKYTDYQDYFTLGTPNITPPTVAPFNTPYTFYNNNAIRIAAGDQVDDRNSNVIRLKKIGIRMNCQAGLDNVAGNFMAPYSLRFMIVKDTQTVSDANALTPLSNLLQQGASTNDWAIMTSFQNVTTQRARYKVLYDKIYRFSGSNSSQQITGGPTNPNQYALKDINITKTLSFGKRGMSIYYNGDSAGDIQKNALYFVIFTDNQQSATSATSVSLQVRSYFVENL